MDRKFFKSKRRQADVVDVASGCKDWYYATIEKNIKWLNHWKLVQTSNTNVINS